MEKMDTAKIKKQEKDIEIDERKKKQKIPFMQVDKGGDIFSNFLSNFLRQFKNQEGNSLLGLVGSLLRLKSKPRPKQSQPANPSDIMGPIKDDAKLAKERRERWQEVKKNMPQDLSQNKSRNTSLKAANENESPTLANKAKKPGLRL
ncbi:hypothetical protein [Flavobacterium akiainvivens]|uniref:hypothetical protein n=1 Tax=Flavobacterium akiainvivens TaxID=1202724 RepID=UPI0006C8D88C|nr:hypothetical protein [Flavobacterium akiainvivens]SFQ77788.1 hypothetical protein SAMN05444144_1274 [Flavobacterium akiainvivens]